MMQSTATELLQGIWGWKISSSPFFPDAQRKRFGMDELLGWGIFWTSFLISKYEYLVSYPKYICCLFSPTQQKPSLAALWQCSCFMDASRELGPPKKKSFKSINERSCLGDSTTTGLRLGSTQMFSLLVGYGTSLLQPQHGARIDPQACEKKITMFLHLP